MLTKFSRSLQVDSKLTNAVIELCDSQCNQIMKLVEISEGNDLKKVRSNTQVLAIAWLHHIPSLTLQVSYFIRITIND